MRLRLPPGLPPCRSRQRRRNTTVPVQPVPAVLAVLRRSRDRRRRRGNRDRAVPRGLLSLLSALLLRNPGGAVLLPADRRLLPAGRGLCALALYPAGLCRAGNRRPGIAAPDGASPTLSRALPR